MNLFDIHYEQYKNCYDDYIVYCRHGNPISVKWAKEQIALCLTHKIKLSQDDHELLKSEQRLSTKTYKKLCKVANDEWELALKKASDEIGTMQNYLKSLADKNLVDMYYNRHTKSVNDFMGNNMVFVDAYDIGCPNRGSANHKECKSKAYKLRQMGFNVEIHQASYNYDTLHNGTRRACYKGILANVNDVVGLYFATFEDIPFHLWKADSAKELELIKVFYTRPYPSLYLYHFTDVDLDVDKPQYRYEKLEE